MSPAVSTRIDRVSPDDEAGLAAAAGMLSAYWREVLGPDEPDVPITEMHLMMRVDRPDIDVTILLARDGSDVVGYGYVDIRRGAGNEHMAWAPDLYVAIDHRRRGIGRALLDEMTAMARAADRSLLLGGRNVGHAAAEAFATAVGATVGNTEVQNRVATAALDRALLESWNVPAPGYSLFTFDDRCPDDMLDAVVALKNVMNDAPRTEAIDEFIFTADQRRRAEAEHAVKGAREWFVAARHDETGELAGYTELMVMPYKPWHVEQGDTAVAPAHRGHGIGRWLKAVNALRVLDEWSEGRWIETWNDGSNQWMLAINTAMGFRPVARWVDAELSLS